MHQAVRLPIEIIQNAQKVGAVMSRSGTKQLLHWIKIGKMIEENPDLPYEAIKNILISKIEKETGQVERYEFGN